MNTLALRWGSLRLGATASAGLGAALGLVEHNLTDGQRVSVLEDMTEKTLTYTELPPGSIVLQLFSTLPTG